MWIVNLIQEVKYDESQEIFIGLFNQDETYLRTIFNFNTQLDMLKFLELFDIYTDSDNYIYLYFFKVEELNTINPKTEGFKIDLHRGPKY